MNTWSGRLAMAVAFCAFFATPSWALPLTVFPNLNGTPIGGQSIVAGPPAGGIQTVALPIAGKAIAAAPGATFFGTFTFNDNTDSLVWTGNPALTSGAAGASSNGQYILLASATYTSPGIHFGDFPAFLDGSLTTAAGAAGFVGKEFVSVAAFATNASLSAPAITTWVLSPADIGKAGPVDVLQNATPFQIPFGSYTAGTGLLGIYVKFQLGPNQILNLPLGVNACGDTTSCIDAAPDASAGPVLPALPEPATLTLLGIGLVGIGFLRRKHKCVR